MHEDQIHVDILSGEQKGLSVQFPDSTVDGKRASAEARGESILYIFSAIEQSPRSADRRTPQRETGRGGDGEKKGEEERESASVRLRGSTLRLMVLWCVCMYVCGECGELPLALARGPTQQGFCGWDHWRRGSLMVGTPLPASSQPVPAQREQGLLSLAFFRPLALLFFFFFFSVLQGNPKWGGWKRFLKKKAERTTTTERTAASALNTRWKPCCVLVYTSALERSPRCVCAYKIYSARGRRRGVHTHTCACSPLSAC